MKRNKMLQGQLSFPEVFSMGVSDKELPVKEKEERKSSAKKDAKESRQEVSAIEKFYRIHNGIIIDDSSDEASVNAKRSKDFQSFCRKLKNALKKDAKERGFDDVSLKPNHYDMSGFFKKGTSYVYWSFSVERYGVPTSLDREGFLYRLAKSDKDFKGGRNHYSDLKGLLDGAERLIREQEKKRQQALEKSLDELSEEELKSIIEEKTGISFEKDEDKKRYMASLKKGNTIYFSLGNLKTDDQKRVIFVGYDKKLSGGASHELSIEGAVSYLNRCIERKNAA